MNIFQNFWRYWKWLCVALMTTFVVLALAAAIIDYFKSQSPPNAATKCLHNGGTWDEGEELCKSLV